MKLKNVVLANSLFSSTTGFVMLLFSNEIANILNIYASLIIKIIGVNLVVFSLSLALIIRYSRYSLVKYVILLDWLWVLGSLGLILWFFDKLSIKGNALILILATIVLLLVLLQQRFLKHFERNTSLKV